MRLLRLPQLDINQLNSGGRSSYLSPGSKSPSLFLAFPVSELTSGTLAETSAYFSIDSLTES